VTLKLGQEGRWLARIFNRSWAPYGLSRKASQPAFIAAARSCGSTLAVNYVAFLAQDLGDNAAGADYLPHLQSAAHRALGVVERLSASGAR
jgi:hypothetical protein